MNDGFRMNICLNGSGLIDENTSLGLANKFWHYLFGYFLKLADQVERIDLSWFWYFGIMPGCMKMTCVCGFRDRIPDIIKVWRCSFLDTALCVEKPGWGQLLRVDRCMKNSSQPSPSVPRNNHNFRVVINMSKCHVKTASWWCFPNLEKCGFVVPDKNDT